MKSAGRFFVAVQDHYIFIDLWQTELAEIVCMMEIQEQKTGDEVELNIRYLTLEQRHREDELFYQEIFYRFCRERNLKNLPVYMAINGNMLMVKKFDFPQMPDVELKKALSWEMADFKQDYVYDYDSKLTDEKMLVVDITLCAKEFITQWQEAVLEQRMRLVSVFTVNEEENETKFLPKVKFNVDEEYLSELKEAVDFSKIKNHLSYLLLKRKNNNELEEFLPLNERATYLDWHKISTVIIACLAAFTISIGTYNVVRYLQLKKQVEITQERLSLLQNDIALMNDLKIQEGQIKNRQEMLKKIYGQATMLYPLLVNLSAVTLENVKLISVTVDGKEAKLMGKASDYQAMTKYKEQFDTANFMDKCKVEIETSLYNQNDGFVDFILKIDFK